ncbi:tyrosine-type recombinase/integrase [Marivita cryptomonadis]|uniref:tyrosine-type recombinase/integrase n=1 Tax=Marivita cryptomonadis TaxID=505252 RepID=UPI00391D9D77
MMIPFLTRSKSREDQHRSSGDTLTVSVFFDDHYFPHAQATKRVTQHDWGVFNKHIRPNLGRYLMVDLTNPVLDVWVREQLVAGYQRATINKHIHLMNRMLNLARHWGHIPQHNPYQHNIKRLRLGDYKQRFLTETEIERLLQVCRSNRHPYIYHIVQLLLLTGARKGEVRTMRWQDVDFNKRIWTVPLSKNGRSRRVVLSSAAVDALNATRAVTEDLMLPTKPDSFVFTNPITRTAYHSFNTVWFKVRGEAELNDVRMHDLRHTYASLLINRGVSLYEVQRLLGHSSLQMTQRYAHLEPDLLHRRTELLSGVINTSLRD